MQPATIRTGSVRVSGSNRKARIEMTFMEREASALMNEGANTFPEAHE